MIDRKLKSLSDLPVPAASADAQSTAMRAALAAFDEAQSTANKKTSEQPQGARTPNRPTHMNSPKSRRTMMRLQSSHYAIAASIAAAFIAVPASLHYINQERSARYPGLHNEPVPNENHSPLASPDSATDLAKAPAQLPKRDEAAAKVIATEDKAKNEASRRAIAEPAAELPTAPAPSAVETGVGTSGQAILGVPNDAGRSRSFGKFESKPPGGSQLGGFVDSVPPAPYLDTSRDRFEHVSDNPLKEVASDPISTFSIDVDTASYGFIRRSLNGGHLPPADAVRIEEMINYFNYDYAAPKSPDVPFQPTITVLPSVWSPGHQLVHIAIKGYELKSTARPRANLVFLIDVSGSMQPADRLPLIKSSLKMLLDNLKPDDTVGLVTYASGSGIALEPTKVSDKAKIIAAIDALGAGGSTAGAAGIEDAYSLIESNFDKSAINRVILATDGDFNVGIADQNQLKSVIERKRQSGIFLSIIGVGQGNYNDSLMQTLAQNGNGTAAYIDTLNEARKVLVEEASSTLFPIAKDVKIQVEFNPAEVSEYRLIGYETRALRREDFNNDKVDAGDVGSGHAVTAIYEITPAGSRRFVDDLRYGRTTTEANKSEQQADAKPGELGFLKLRYKLPKEETSRLIEMPIRNADALQSIDQASLDVRFSIAAAAFGQLLKGGKWTGDYTYDDVIALASKAKGDDPFGLRAEFVNLVRLAKSVK